MTYIPEDTKAKANERINFYRQMQEKSKARAKESIERLKKMAMDTWNKESQNAGKKY